MSSFSADPREREPGVGFVLDPAPPGRSFVADGEAGEAQPDPLEELQALLDKTREEGRAAAREELPWSDAETLRSAASALERAAEALASLRREYLVEHRGAVVELALEIAEKLVRREFSRDPDQLAAILERSLEALGSVAAAERATLQLSEDDYAVLTEGLMPELQRIATTHELDVVAEHTLSCGDLRLFAGHSRVDARLPEVIRHLREELSALTDAEEPEA